MAATEPETTPASMPVRAADVAKTGTRCAPQRRGFGWLALWVVFGAMAGTPLVIALIVTLGH